MSEDILLVEDAPDGNPGVRLLTLNRPERRNALSPELVNALRSALVAADREAGVHAVVITGAGEKAFCAGGDLGAPSGEGFLGMHEDRGAFASLLKTFRRMKTPTVAAVNGMALGGGFGILLACDLAVASSEAALGTPEIKRGLFPMMISRLIYEQLPRRAANELVLLGEKVSGERALELGIVNRTVPAAEVRAAALELAARVASHSPAAMGLGRRAIYRQMDMPFSAAMDHLHDQLTLNLQTEDAAEGISAFFEKRDPKWSGR
jgi:enoyl-CoA hydratase/carnithine racemase